MKEDLKSTRRGGLYWNQADGRPYLSVTTALSIIDKPALRYWYGNEVYNAVIADPSIDRRSAHQAPYATSDKAMSRGSTVHSLVEALKHGAQVETVPEKFQGYLDGFKQWMTDFNVELQEQERTVFSATGYAGTLDLLASVNRGPLPLVIDVKTGKNIYPEAFLQTSAYQGALKEQGVQTAGVGVILLREDGSYVYEYRPETQRYLNGFMAAKTLYEAIHEEDLQKMGYFDSWGRI